MPPILPALAEEIRDRSNSTLHGHLQTTGSQPIMFDGLPNLRFPEAPGIRNAPTLRQRPDDAETPWAEFHLPTTANVPTADSRSSRRKRRSSYRPAAMSSVATASAALCTSRGMSERGFDTTFSPHYRLLQSTGQRCRFGAERIEMLRSAPRHAGPESSVSGAADRSRGRGTHDRRLDQRGARRAQ